jgi:hypothetical protein
MPVAATAPRGRLSLGNPGRGTTKRTKRAKKTPGENPCFHPVLLEDHGRAAGRKTPPNPGWCRMENDILVRFVRLVANLYLLDARV